jgi:hypothetical protein
MARLGPWLSAFVFVVAACGDAAAPSSNDDGPAPSVAVTTTVPRSVSGSTGAPVDPPASTTAPAAKPAFDGPPAADFALSLAAGDTFQLSAEDKPIYLVFWAEW